MSLFPTLLSVAAIVYAMPSDPELWRQMLREGRTDEAVAAVQAAVAKNDPDALDFLGWFHDTGTGLPKDKAKAADAYRRAAELGNRHAQWRYGVMLDLGEGVKADPIAAVGWIRSAADRGSSFALASMGVMYSHGRGVPQDHVKALAYYRQSAKLGNAHAFTEIGKVHAMGEGVPVDWIEASAWFLVASRHGEDEAKGLIEQLLKEMDESEARRVVARANAISAEFGLDKD